MIKLITHGQVYLKEDKWLFFRLGISLRNVITGLPDFTLFREPDRQMPVRAITIRNRG
jgi:hypothetical protein